VLIADALELVLQIEFFDACSVVAYEEMLLLKLVVCLFI
jgi:hypothetical protein